MRIAILSLIILSILTTSCGSSRKAAAAKNNSVATSNVDTASSSSSAAEGSSFEKAVLINETSEGKGVAAEYTWLKKNYPGHKVLSQSLSYKDQKPYDVLSIETADGTRKKVYFDISNFFGKF